MAKKKDLTTPAASTTPAPSPTQSEPTEPTMASRLDVGKERTWNLVIGSVLLLLAWVLIWPWCKKQMKDITARPANAVVSLMTQPPARKEIVAPVGEWSPAENVAGVFKFTLAYGGPVEVRLKRFDGKFEIKSRDPNGPSVDLGRFETIAFRSLGGKPVTNWIVFPN